MEHWVEVNLEAELEVQDRILLDELRPFVRRLERIGELATFHFFREPEIRFRIRLGSADARAKHARELEKIAEGLMKRRLISEWHFGSHGEAGKAYLGEEDRYGKNGWGVAQEYFRKGADTALDLLELKRGSRLENPLWGRGLGNPWEGGDRNPWRRVEKDPLAYHWSRYVHLFSNQLGFDMLREAQLASKQAENYRRVLHDIRMSW